MLKSLLLACAFALVAAQTTTDGPEMETVVVTTFQGDCESLFADPVASAALIGEIDAQLGAGFGVSAGMVATTLSCGSIVGTSVVSGGVAPTAPLAVTSTDFGAASVLITAQTTTDITAPTLPDVETQAAFAGAANCEDISVSDQVAIITAVTATLQELYQTSDVTSTVRASAYCVLYLYSTAYCVL